MEFLCNFPVTHGGVFFPPRVQPSVPAPKFPRGSEEVGQPPPPPLSHQQGCGFCHPLTHPEAAVGDQAGQRAHGQAEGTEQIAGRTLLDRGQTSHSASL